MMNRRNFLAAAAAAAFAPAMFVRAAETKLELNPEQERDHFRRGQLLLAEGQVQDALAEMEQEPREDWRSFGEALAYHAAGRPQESDTALKQLIKIRPSGWAYQIAEVYAYRGEVDKASDWMESRLSTT